MIIEKLHVKNVRLFTELNIDFNPKFNFLVGPNGCGKTSVLVCLAHCFNAQSFEYSRFSDGAEFWADILYNAEKYRVGLGENSIRTDSYRNNTIRWHIPPGENIITSIRSYEAIKKIEETPLFIGAQRHLTYKRIEGMQRENPPEKRREEYQEKNIRSLYGENHTSVKQWIVNRDFMIEKAWAVMEKKNWEIFTLNLPRIAPFGSDFTYIRTGKDFEPVFSLYGKECYLEELSAGYQAVLSLIVEVIAWIEGSMEENNRDVQTASGVVCIDEPDVHLHPEWQLTLRQGLVSLFPNIQFIVTTHSPHLMASAGPGEIIRMPKAYTEERYDLAPEPRSFSGWTTDEILVDVMEVESLENKDYERLIQAAMKAVEQKNIADLKNAICELEKVSHRDNTIIMVLQTKLASLELQNND